MTQADYVGKSGLAHSMVSDWFRGARIPGTSSCVTISDNLRLEVLEAAGIVEMPRELPHSDPRRAAIEFVRSVNPKATKAMIWIESIPALIGQNAGSRKEGG